MTDIQFRALLDLTMVSDPWPLEYGKDDIDDLLDGEARERGYSGWVPAYHDFDHPGMTPDSPQ